MMVLGGEIMDNQYTPGGGYEISFTDGVGYEKVANGDYDVTAQVSGYDNSSITPPTISVKAGVLEYDFKIAASGNLTLHVTEEGTAAGTAVQGATFVRCDSTGTAYGSTITTDATGNAVMPYVPYGDELLVVYYKQTGSATDHEYDPEVKQISLSTSAETVEIANPAQIERTFNVTDLHYEGLKIPSGNLILDKQ